MRNVSRESMSKLETKRDTWRNTWEISSQEHWSHILHLRRQTHGRHESTWATETTSRHDKRPRMLWSIQSIREGKMAERKNSALRCMLFVFDVIFQFIVFPPEILAWPLAVTLFYYEIYGSLVLFPSKNVNACKMIIITLVGFIGYVCGGGSCTVVACAGSAAENLRIAFSRTWLSIFNWMATPTEFNFHFLLKRRTITTMKSQKSRWFCI